MPTPTTPRTHTLRAWVAWWVVCAAEWLALVDHPVLQELVVGAVVAALAATAAVLVRRQRRRLLHPRTAWLPLLARPVAGLVTDLRPLVSAVVRRRGGELVEVRYSGDAAHRAVTEALGSLAPNTIVVAVDEEREVLVAHQLVRDERRVLPLGEE